jgi:uncharacterized protein with HEPN domain
MPERDWRLRIHDIVTAIEKIERYTAGMSLAEFQADERSDLKGSLRSLSPAAKNGRAK